MTVETGRAAGAVGRGGDAVARAAFAVTVGGVKNADFIFVIVLGI